MMCKKYVLLALVTTLILPAGAMPGLAQESTESLKVTGSLPRNPLPPPATSGQIPLNATTISPQSSPEINVPNSSTADFEHNDSVASLPRIFTRQWSLTNEVPPESLISERYIRSVDPEARALSLKEAVYIALRNNPNIEVAVLNPIASVESIRVANGNFDPNLTSQIDTGKTVIPTTSTLVTGGAPESASKIYDWNFGVNKVSSITNGTFGATFLNNRTQSNSLFASVNPSYTPSITVSLSQPLLQSFGWRFATINVRIAESNQKVSQWNYGQTLQDFVQRIGNEYWGVVLAEENLEVYRAALRFNIELVRENTISVRVGTLAPLDLQEAQSAEATAEANVYTGEAQLKNARAQLRQDVMLNPQERFIPEEIEPSTRPNPQQMVAESEERSLELAVQYRPSLAGLRESIRNALLQVKYSENQSLPTLNLGTQFGLNSTAGTTPCSVPFSTSTVPINCAATNPAPPPATLPGNKLPFGGIYGDALNRLWGFSFYSYAAVLSFQMPLDNAVPRAQLAQARILYEQSRMLYRASLSQAVVDVETGISDLYADVKRAQATAQATYYAKQALHDEEVRFRVGMATTHDLLQFQEEEVSAEGNQVQAEVDLENARLALSHAEGTLLQDFQIDFQLQNPHETPWYATF
ncbi:MAG: TolC family protein [Candidatus Binataceae bacterium]